MDKGSFWTSWESPFPKMFDSHEHTALRACLIQYAQPFNKDTGLHLPRFKLFPRLHSALIMADKDRAIIRGLTEIKTLLQHEQNGLERLSKIDPNSFPVRISRLLFISNDGSNRFNNHVETIISQCLPRLSAVMLDHDSNELHQLLYGKTGLLKAFLAYQKNPVNLIIRSLHHLTDV
jgi:hypothetical protein